MASERPSLDRPAFYALRTGGWRDLVTLLHPPYTLWHLSYVALGAAAAPVLHGNRLAAALGAFFLAVGISAHALDELNGRPLGTVLPRGALIALAAAGLAGAVAIGVAGRRRGLPAPRSAGGGGSPARPRLQPRARRRAISQRSLVRFGLGRLPGLHRLFRPDAVDQASGCARGGSMLPAERGPAPAEHAGSRAPPPHGRGTGEQQLSDGTRVELTKAHLAAPLEGALSALWLAVVLLAAGLVAVRL